MSSTIQPIETFDNLRDFFNANDGKVCVIDFYATWCKPCMKVGPEFATWATESAGDIAFGKIDIDGDDGTDLMDECGVSKLPSFVVVSMTKDAKKQRKVIQGSNLSVVKQYVASLTLTEDTDF